MPSFKQLPLRYYVPVKKIFSLFSSYPTPFAQDTFSIFQPGVPNLSRLHPAFSFHRHLVIPHPSSRTPPLSLGTALFPLVKLLRFFFIARHNPLSESFGLTLEKSAVTALVLSAVSRFPYRRASSPGFLSPPRKRSKPSCL